MNTAVLPRILQHRGRQGLKTRLEKIYQYAKAHPDQSPDDFFNWIRTHFQVSQSTTYDYLKAVKQRVQAEAQAQTKVAAPFPHPAPPPPPEVADAE